MFSAAWQALLVWGVLILANTATLSPWSYVSRDRKKPLRSAGWTFLLLGNALPLGVVFFTAARAGRLDEGLWLAVAFGMLFIARCGHELGKLGLR